MVFGGDGKDERIPYLQLIVNGEVKCGLESGPGRVRNLEAICPAQDGFSRRGCFSFGFSGEHAEEFAQRLRREQDGFDGKPRYQCTRRFASCFASCAFRIGQDVGVQGDAACSAFVQFVPLPVPCARRRLFVQARQQRLSCGVALPVCHPGRADGRHGFTP